MIRTSFGRSLRLAVRVGPHVSQARAIKPFVWILGLACALPMVQSGAALAQAGGPYRIQRSSIDGGGTTAASGGTYALGGTIGQADAGTASGPTHIVGGGFWGGGTLVAAPTPTPSVTPSVTRTASTAPSATPTSTPPPTLTATRTSSVPVAVATSTPTRTAAPSVTASSVPTPSPSSGTATATPSPTATATPPTGDCPGDCDASGAVSVDELVRGVNIALERAALTVCPAMNTNGDVRITVNELVAAVNAALQGCSGPSL